MRKYPKKTMEKLSLRYKRDMATVSKKAVFVCENGKRRNGSCLRHRISVAGGGDRYNLRGFVDPRLGTADRHMRLQYQLLGLGSPDDESEVDSEDEREKDIIILPPAANIVTTIVEGDPSPGFKDIDEKTWKKMKKRSLKRTYGPRVKNEAQNLKKQDLECAQNAISFYNDKHGTDYEVVETRGSYCRLYIGFWFHCNFKAQLKSASPTGHGLPSSPKLFFAELYRKQPPLYVVNNCQMLDGPGQRPYLTSECKMCRDDQMLHPANGFKVGK